ncbi:MAG: exopolyphosphatase [Gammaproteobacteria bacterium]|nr:exopolyphosphatase [Gammaproteobacteria bacterium]NNM21402.1 exopolyphosphatase [Gammaproteobacteria bacterium]
MSRNLSRQVLAAVDLGSNSFHMVVARYEHGQLQVIDRLREMVRLAAGLDRRSKISRKASDRALKCLARFGQRLRDMRAESVRAVGTNALRKARNATDFLQAAEEALGHPIEVVSGREEARLVYLGAAHSLPEQPGARLVADIGGGSTELILGSGFETRELFSLYMGCVSITEKFFPGGKISARRWQRARLAAAIELEPVKEQLQRLGWQQVVGTSGTIRAARNVLLEQGWSDGPVTQQGLANIEQHMISHGHIDKLELQGLSSQRVPVFPGGAVILQTMLAELNIDSMLVARGALREGLLYDMLGQLADRDVRDRSVRALEQRYHVDVEHGGRVERTALALFDQVADDWRINTPFERKLLSWAARLHEMGLGIAHSQYQRHGWYLLENSDVAGFSIREKTLLARLVLCHRRKVQQQEFQSLPKPWTRKLPQLAVLLRLAVLLHRGRSANSTAPLELAARKRRLKLRVPAAWLDKHPLTRADLRAEARYLRSINFRLQIEAT